MPSFAMLTHFIRNQYSRLPYPKHSFAGQTVIVVGANVGLGFEASVHYVRLGAEKVILAVRSVEKGNDAKRKIEERTGKRGVAEVWQLDLSKYESVKSFAKKAESLPRIDVLLENAGVAMPEWTTAEGSEMTMTVNVYGTFLLAMLMYPLLQKSAKTQGINAVLTIVSSEVHHFPKFKEGEQKDIVATLDDENFWNKDDRYPISKLVEVYFVRELATKVNQESTGVTMNLVNPGLCQSELARNADWVTHVTITIMKFLLARTTEVGSRTLVYATTGGPETHGAYSADCEFNPRAVSRFVRSDQGKKMQEKVFDQVSRKLETIEPGLFRPILVS